MNDQDLERDLRTQRSPREDGYVPVRLPMTLDEAPVASRRPSRLPGAVVLVGAGVAGALAVAIAAGVFSGSQPDVGATGSASPSAEASTPAGGDCGIADLALSAEPWGGAAGSRGTVVTVILADGASPCSLRLPVSAQIADANGMVLVSGRTPSATGSVAIEAGASFDIGIAWSNWCDGQPAAPLTLLLAPAGQSPSPVGAPGSVPGSAVPPCNGSGSSNLSMTDLQPQP
jgi:hypothetical protein